MINEMCRILNEINIAILEGVKLNQISEDLFNQIQKNKKNIFSRIKEMDADYFKMLEILKDLQKYFEITEMRDTESIDYNFKITFFNNHWLIQSPFLILFENKSFNSFEDWYLRAASLWQTESAESIIRSFSQLEKEWDNIIKECYYSINKKMEEHLHYIKTKIKRQEEINDYLKNIKNNDD